MTRFLVVSLVVIVAGCLQPAWTHGDDCDAAKVDLVIFMEDFQDTTTANFDTEIDFIQDLIDMTTISTTQVQIAVARVDDNANVEFDLDANGDNSNLLTAVGTITEGADLGTLEFEDGFETVFNVKDIFASTNGGRDDAQKYLLFLVASKFDHVPELMDTAAAVHKAGIETVVIAGGGLSAPYKELFTRPMASDPNLFFTVTNFNDIANVLPSLEKMVCKGPPEILSFTANSGIVTVTSDGDTSVRFKCRVEGNDAPVIRIFGQYTGKQVVTRIPRSYVFIQEADVMVTLKAGQSDEFVCSATNDAGGTVQSSGIKILVNGPPEFHGTPNLDQPLTVGADNSVSFSVDILSQPEPVPSSYSLTKTSPGGPVTVNPAEFSVTFQSVAEGRQGTLDFTMTSPPYDSEYTLTVDNGHGTLDIPFKVVNNSAIPQVTAFTANSAYGTLTVASGSTVTFRCEATGIPVPSLSLTGSYSPAVNMVSLGSSSPSSSAGSLEWSVVVSSRWSDVVTCTALSSLGKSQQFIGLVVTGPPLLHDESDTADFSTNIQSDGRVSISFNVISHPAPRQTGYVLTFHPPGQAPVIVNPYEYTATFVRENALYVRVQLEFSRSPEQEVDSYSYTLTVDNGEAQQLDIPFTALYPQGPPTLSKKFDMSDFLTVIMTGGSVSISLAVTSQPSPTHYVLTFHPPGQGIVTLNPNDYTITFDPSKERVHLEFTMAFPDPERLANKYILTVYNSLGQEEIPFTALFYGYTPEVSAPSRNTAAANSAKDTDNSDMPPIVMGCVLGGLLLVMLLVQALVILTLRNKVSLLQKHVMMEGFHQGPRSYPTRFQPHPKLRNLPYGWR